MSQLKLALRENCTRFRPGEEIAGAAGWKLAKPPERVEVRLFYRTEGKGTSDVMVVETVRFENPQLEEARPFAFRAPLAPYSFSGRIISLVWALEMVVQPGNESERVEVVIAPSAEEVMLHGHS